MVVPPVRTRPLGETRVEAARRQGTYEHLRTRIETLLLHDQLTHLEVAERLGISPRQERFICQVLGIKTEWRRNRWSLRQAQVRRVDHAINLWMAMRDDYAVVRDIREYTAAWDRGW